MTRKNVANGKRRPLRQKPPERPCAFEFAVRGSPLRPDGLWTTAIGAPPYERGPVPAADTNGEPRTVNRELRTQKNRAAQAVSCLTSLRFPLATFLRVIPALPRQLRRACAASG